jgi:hypothetical protein
VPAGGADHIRLRLRMRSASAQRLRADGTGLPVGDGHWPCLFSPCAQKWRIFSQLFNLKAPIVRVFGDTGSGRRGGAPCRRRRLTCDLLPGPQASACRSTTNG